MSHRRRRLLGLSVLAILIVAVLLTGRLIPVAEGPLADPLWASDLFAGKADPGSIHSFAWTSLRNPQAEPAVLDLVSLKEPVGLELLGAYTVPYSEIPQAINRDYTFPPRGWENVRLAPANGSAIPPYQGTEETDINLLLQLKVPETKGEYSFAGIILDYHVGDTRYRVIVPHSLKLCTPPEAFEEC